MVVVDGRLDTATAKRPTYRMHCDHSDDGAHDRADDGPLLGAVGGGLASAYRPGPTARRPWWSTRSTQSRAGGNTRPCTESPRRGSCPARAGLASLAAGPASPAAAAGPASPAAAAGPANPAAGPANLGNLRRPWGITHGNCLPLGCLRSKQVYSRAALQVPKSGKYTARACLGRGDRERSDSANTLRNRFNRPQASTVAPLLRRAQ